MDRAWSMGTLCAVHQGEAREPAWHVSCRVVPFTMCVMLVYRGKARMARLYTSRVGRARSGPFRHEMSRVRPWPARWAPVTYLAIPPLRRCFLKAIMASFKTSLE